MISDNQPDIRLSRVIFDVSDSFLNQALQQWHLRVPAQLEAAVLKRKTEFLAGRRAAQLALKQALAECPQLDQDHKGRPVWPKGFVGSISHSTSACRSRSRSTSVAVACTAPSDRYSSLGIDIEHWVKPETAEKLCAHVLVEQERWRLADDIRDLKTLFTLVFAAKESLYKLLNPLTDVFFGFHDAHCTLVDLDNKRIELELLNPVSDDFPAGTRFKGHFECFEHTVLCLLTLPA